MERRGSIRHIMNSEQWNKMFTEHIFSIGMRRFQLSDFLLCYKVIRDMRTRLLNSADVMSRVERVFDVCHVSWWRVRVRVEMEINDSLKVLTFDIGNQHLASLYWWEFSFFFCYKVEIYFC